MGNVRDALKKHQAETAAGEAADKAADKAAAPEKSKKPSAGARKTPAQRAPKGHASPVIADIDGRKYSELLVAHHDRGGAITEEYRALRTSLLAQCPDGKFCLLVTSAEAGEGKSVTCANLAVVLTERIERRTVLVDCDLRRGKMARTFNTDSSPGLAELMLGTASLEDVVQPTAYTNLFFIPGGRAKASEAGELLGRPEKADIVNALRRQYDHVIFDTPPINIVSDAGTIGRAIGEALLVVRMSKTRRESIDKAVRLLHAADVTLAGIVLTHRKYYIPNYLYRYS